MKIRQGIFQKMLLLLVFLAGFMGQVFSQAPKIKSLKVDRKNSKLKITCIEQSPDGFIWLGTNKGLLKFDGLNYNSIETGVEESGISVLHFHDNLLYAGFENGSLVRLDITTGKVAGNHQVTSKKITGVLVDRLHRTWFSTYGDGVWMIDSLSVVQFNEENGLSDNQAYGIARLEDREEVLVATDNGISVIEKRGEMMTVRRIGEEQGLQDNLVTALLAMGNGNFVVGTQSGVVCNYNIDSNSFHSYKVFDNFEGSCVNDLSNIGTEIWIATASSGLLSCIWPGTDDLQQYNLSAYLENGPVLDILPDQEGNILVAGGHPELLLVDTRLCFITLHDSVDFRDISAILCDHEGNFWFSTREGLYEHSANFISSNLVRQWLYELDKKGISITSIYEDYKGNIWFGTFDKGLGRIDGESGAIRWFTEKDGLVNNNVLSICGNHRELWFATLGGASRIMDLDKPQFTNYNESSPLGGSYIYNVYSDEKERVWFGTDGKGPVFYENGEFHFLMNELDSASKTIVSITEDRSGNIWFYSAENELTWYDGERIHHEEITNEGNEVKVFAIHGDDLGSIVLFTSDGIAVLKEDTGELTYLETDQMYHSNYLNTISKDPQGQFWIGAEEALIRLREIVPGKVNHPQTIITRVLEFLQPIEMSPNLVLNSNQNHISFEFTGLWFRDPEKVSYQYKLDGYSLDWTSTRDNMVSFPQLPPGPYTFRVKSSVSSGFENVSEASVSFTIREPYYKTWWFIALALLLVLGLILLIYTLRLNAFRRRESIQRERIQSQFETLKNQVNPHFLFNSLNTLISLISTEKNLAIDYVEKLSEYFRTILRQQDKDVITVEEELLLVQNYFYLQKKRFGENLTLDVDIPEELMQTSIPPLTLQILAENAVKHNVISRTKPLSLRIYSSGNQIIVTNNLQEKMTREVSTGIGLKNISNRYSILFNKAIQVTKGEKEYSVRLPVIKSLK